MRPDLSRIAPFYHNYISQVKEDDLAKAFTKYSSEFIQFLNSIPASKYDYCYAEGKWTIREVLQHIIDSERVFCYRALRFARKDNTPLPGFDENLFAQNSNAGKRDWQSLVEEFKAVRKSSEYLFNTFDKEQLEANGLANNTPNYVLGIGFIIVGHSMHHKKITEERYL
jgi:DinB superfamily